MGALRALRGGTDARRAAVVARLVSGCGGWRWRAPRQRPLGVRGQLPRARATVAPAGRRDLPASETLHARAPDTRGGFQLPPPWAGGGGAPRVCRQAFWFHGWSSLRGSLNCRAPSSMAGLLGCCCTLDVRRGGAEGGFRGVTKATSSYRERRGPIARPGRVDAGPLSIKGLALPPPSCHCHKSPRRGHTL